MDRIELFADGACLGNPGPGGWAYLLRKGAKEKLDGGKVRYTTNNCMELTAVIKGLQFLKSPRVVHVVTDSRYVVDGMTSWLANWKAKGRLDKSGSKPVKNVELWQKLDELCQKHDVTWEWTKGHAGHPENERVDQEASKQALAAKALRKGADQ